MTTKPKPGTQPIRLVLLAPTLGSSGGLVRFSREVVRAIESVSTGDDIQIDIIVRHSEQAARATVEHYGLRANVHRVSVLSGSLRERLDSMRAVRSAVSRLRPDVVIAPVGSVWLLVGALLSDRRIGVVAINHGQPTPALVPRQERRIVKWLVRHHKGEVRLLANSDSLRSELDRTVGVTVGTSRSLPVGIDPVPDIVPERDCRDLREAFGFDEDDVVVAVLGRVVAGKRVEQVVDLAASWPIDNRLRVVVCGDGPALASVRSRVEAAGLSDTIRFTGRLSDPTPILCGVDILVHPSESEGAPFVIIEALHCGLPVVAYPVGGIPDLVEQPADGCLASGPDVTDLSRALASVLERCPADADARLLRADRARERFSLERMGRSYLELVMDMARR